jgi:hypothetical protein
MTERDKGERVVDPETTKKMMRRILDEGVIPHAVALARIWLNEEVAVVVFEVADECKDGLRILGWNGEAVFALNRTRAEKLAARSDPVTAAWLRRRGPRRMFLWSGSGTLLMNCEEGKGWSTEPGSTDMEWMN